MRREWRNVLVIVILSQIGIGSAYAQQEIGKDGPGSSGELVRLTLDLSWGVPANGVNSPETAVDGDGAKSERDLVLELSEGRVLDALAWPPEERRFESGSLPMPAGTRQGPGPDGTWRLGNAPQGRVRVRVEAPLDAAVIVRGGDELRVTLPLLAILERPQHTPQQSPLMVKVERLAWDSLKVDLADPASDGIVAPGSDIPVSVAFNILWPESADVAVRTTASMRSIRGGDVLGRFEPRDREVVATNRRESTIRTWSCESTSCRRDLRAGSQRLVGVGRQPRELGAGTFYPAAPAGGRAQLGRSSRGLHGHRSKGRARRRPGTMATVAKPRSTAIDLTRSRSYRPLASGRSPAAEPGRFAWAVPAEALIEPSRRDRLLRLDHADRRRGRQARPGQRIGTGVVGRRASRSPIPIGLTA